MIVFKVPDRLCKRCGKPFSPHALRQFYCGFANERDKCMWQAKQDRNLAWFWKNPEMNRERNRIKMQNHRRRKSVLGVLPERKLIIPKPIKSYIQHLERAGLTKTRNHLS